VYTQLTRDLFEIPKCSCFTLSNSELRGHELKIYKSQIYLDIGKYFFQ